MFKLKLKFKIPFDFNDVFIVAGTSLFTYGAWGFDPRVAMMVLGVWLIFLGRPQGGGS